MSPANWYVDSVNGNDSFTGTSPYTPFKTLAKLQAQTIVSGQTIALATGSVWHEQVTVPASNLALTAYGTGAMPLIDASDSISSSAWTLVNGTTKCYQATVSISESATSWVNMWENGATLVRPSSNSAAQCDATAGSYYPSADAGQTSITLFIHPTGDTNPTSNGKAYDYSSRLYSIYSPTYSGLTVNGIWTRRNLEISGSLFTSNPGTVLTNGRASDGNKHNIQLAGGSSVSNYFVDNAYFNGAGLAELVFFGASTGQMGNVSVANSSFVNASTEAATQGVLSHTTGGFTFGTSSMSNVNISGAISSFGFNNVTSTTIAGGTITGTIVPVPSIPIVLNNVTQNVPAFASGNASGRGIDGQNSGINITINGGSYTTNTTNTNTISVTSGTLTINGATLKNNNLFTVIYVTGTNSVLTMNNTTITANTTGHSIENYNPATFVGNNNTYKTGNTWVWGGTTYSTLAAWRAAVGQDANSVSN